jgi:hypothetical protein
MYYSIGLGAEPVDSKINPPVNIPIEEVTIPSVLNKYPWIKGSTIADGYKIIQSPDVNRPQIVTLVGRVAESNLSINQAMAVDILNGNKIWIKGSSSKKLIYLGVGIAILGTAGFFLTRRK